MTLLLGEPTIGIWHYKVLMVVNIRSIIHAAIAKRIFQLTFCLILAVVAPAEYGFCTTISPSPEPAPEVLVIHSYYPTFTWSDNITQGIRKAFTKDGQQEAHTYFEFLDAKRHPEEQYLEQQAQLLRMKYPNTEALDLVICSDDQALNFLLDRTDTLFSGVPIVFCGVNGYSPQMRERKHALTGVIEAIDPHSTLEAELRLQPTIREVLVINDITLRWTVSL